MEAVRRALEHIGGDASPGQIVEYVKTHHGHDMTPKFASSYKSTILRTEARRQVPQRFQEESDDFGASEGVSLRDIKTLKELAGRYGADQLRELLDLLYSND